MHVREVVWRGRVRGVCTTDKGGHLERASFSWGFWERGSRRAYNGAQRASDDGHTGGEHKQIGNADIELHRNGLELGGDIFEALILIACECLLSKNERAVTATGLALVNGPRAAIVEH